MLQRHIFFYKLFLNVSVIVRHSSFSYKLLISVSVFVQYYFFICVPRFSYFIFRFGTVNLDNRISVLKYRSSRRSLA